ncbi:MAG: RNA polymerase factor sigma-54 [Flavobacteriales bacterium]|nr:RNA polymerase factor sigma-54 [Flavobacteriales bacterium]
MFKQTLNLKLTQKLSPQQIQLMKLIQLPTQAFEQKIKEEIIENPALESGKEEENTSDEFEYTEDYEENDYDTDNERDEINIEEYISDDEIPDYKTKSNNYSDEEERVIPIVSPVSFHQSLINQLNTFVLNEVERQIAEFLVGSIDDLGYIRRTNADIVDDLAFTQGIYADEITIEKVFNIIHELEPKGVGARDLQECLLLQLKDKSSSPARENAICIIADHFDAFTKKHYTKLITKLNINQDQLKDIISEIEKLNPKPGGSYNSGNSSVEHIIPDFTITIEEDELKLQLNSRNAPELHISRDYKDMLQGYKESHEKSASQKEAVQFIKQKLDAAKWFIDAIKQRQETLIVTMSAIMEFQKDYFLEGNETLLKPMILKDIADRIGLDISTVSRVANSKYVDTPYGTKLIKEFFSESMTNDKGEEVSTIEIKKILEQIIEEEDKRTPLTDEKLVVLLKDKGYPIARRTVAKYREQLNIPIARMRKTI